MLDYVRVINFLLLLIIIIIIIIVYMCYAKVSLPTPWSLR